MRKRSREEIKVVKERPQHLSTQGISTEATTRERLRLRGGGGNKSRPRDKQSHGTGRRSRDSPVVDRYMEQEGRARAQPMMEERQINRRRKRSR